MTARAEPDAVVSISLPTPFPVGAVNAYLFKGEAVTLVDTGPNSEESHDRLVRALGEHGVKPSDLEVILITHGHLDHMGGLARLLEETDAAAYAHPLAVERARDLEASSGENARFHREILREFGVPEALREDFAALPEPAATLGRAVDIGHAVEHGDRVGPFTVHHVPGHSPSDVLFVHDERRFAFTGDHILKGVNPNPLLRRPPPGRPRPKALVDYLDSLRRTRALDLDVCYPGHGEPITNMREAVDALLARNESRLERVFSALSERPMTPYEVCRKLYPKLEVSQLILGLSAVVGSLEVLEERGRVRSERADTRLLYRRTLPET